MPLGRRHERREGRREDRRGVGQVHYRMRQRLVSIGDDFWLATDGVETAPDQDPVTVLTATAAIDMMAHESG